MVSDDKQLDRICSLSHSVPDPRFLDVIYTSNTSANSNANSKKTSNGGTHPGTTTVPTVAHYILPPPPTTLRSLSACSTYNRAVWRITGQVVFVRKIVVSLRCKKCQVLAKQFNRMLGFQCAKCNETHTLAPYWGASLAFDDATGECNLHIEGAELVLPLIRAKFDDKAAVLNDIKILVDKHVLSCGILIFDAFGRSDQQNRHALNKTYTMLV